MLIGRWFFWGEGVVGSSKLATRNQFWFGTFWTLAGAALFTLPFLWVARFNPFTITAKQPASPSLRSRIRRNILASIPHAFLLKPVFAYHGLRGAVKEVAAALEANNLAEARHLLSRHLVSRDTRNLTKTEVAGAAIESLAENLTDSVTAPLLAYAIGGLPAAWAYRFVNTADALWGYRTPEFEDLGKFPARLDDALNWLPARLTGWLLVASAKLAGLDHRNAKNIMLSQHHRPASPNAGWTMAAMAGALNITLAKRDIYELRGGQNNADATTIKQALRVAGICAALSIALLCGGVITSAIAGLRPKNTGANGHSPLLP